MAVLKRDPLIATCLRATSSTDPCRCDACLNFVRYWNALTNQTQTQEIR